MSHWFAVLEQMPSASYAEQMARLQDGAGFSRAHANAVVMYCRGSASSRRFDDIDAYLAGADPVGAATIRAIISAITNAHPSAEIVIAWNHPMVRIEGAYAFGMSLAARHILLAPTQPGVLDAFRPRLGAYVVNKKTFRVPLDWDVDAPLLADMIRASRDS